MHISLEKLKKIQEENNQVNELRIEQIKKDNSKKA